jgi:hypothetical protein
MTGQREDAMSAFSDAELHYLGSQRLGRMVSWSLEDGFQGRSLGLTT